MTYGRAARFAYDPKVIVAFLDHHTTRERCGTPTRMRRLINGKSITQDVDARTIRRWRQGRIEGATREAVKRIFRRTGLTLQEFHDWAEANNLDPVLRDTDRRH